MMLVGVRHFRSSGLQYSVSLHTGANEVVLLKRWPVLLTSFGNDFASAATEEAVPHRSSSGSRKLSRQAMLSRREGNS